jgi:serine/threonine protein phosphatase PrpC
MEHEQGFSIPRSLPMTGGTTATTAIVFKKYLSLAWVGDSRAVLCAVRKNIKKNKKKSLLAWVGDSRAFYVLSDTIFYL